MESTAIQNFISQHYNAVDQQLKWRELSSVKDFTHSHHTYALYFGDRKVIDHHLKIHYNLKGFVQYASSDLESSFSVSLPTHNPSQIEKIKGQIEEEATKRWGTFNGRIRIETILQS